MSSLLGYFIGCIIGAALVAIFVILYPVSSSRTVTVPVKVPARTSVVAPTPTQLRRFFKVVNQSIPNLGDNEVLALSEGLCTELVNGASIKDIATTITDSGFSLTQSDALLNVTVHQLCPSQLAKLYAFT